MRRPLWALMAAVAMASGCHWPWERRERESPPPAPAAGAAPVDSAALAPLLEQTRLARSAAAEEGAEDASAAAGLAFDGSSLREGLRAEGFAEEHAGDAVVVPASFRPSRPMPIGSAVLRPAASVSRPGLDARTVPPPPAEAAGAREDEGLSAFAAFQGLLRAAAAPVLARLDWGARAHRGRRTAMTPRRVTVHHTTGRQTFEEADTIREARGIQRYHMEDQGWRDIGYHFLIDGRGRIVQGRPLETRGSHAGDENGGNIGIALMGNFNRDQPTPAQLDSLTRLVSFLAVRYGQDPEGREFLETHRHYDNTECPGRNLEAALADLRARVARQTPILQARLAASPRGTFVAVVATDA